MMWDESSQMLANAGDAAWSWGHPTWSWVMGLHGLVWLLSAALAVAALVLLIRSFTLGRSRSFHEASPTSLDNAEPRSALDILKAGYAGGEIGRDEYMRKVVELS